MSPSLRKHHTRGFTLIEVLVALLVLALALSALQLRMSQHLDSAAYLRDKTIASWVALNQLELLRIATRMGSPPPGAIEGSVSMAGRTWYWALTPQQQNAAVTDSADAPVLVGIGISPTSTEAARSEPIASLTGVTDAWE